MDTEDGDALVPTATSNSRVTIAKSQRVRLSEHNVMKGACLRLEEYPYLGRAVLPKHALAGFGRAWHPWVPSWDGFGESFEVHEYSYFLSHSWHANSWIKVFALYAYFNGLPAVVLGMLMAMLCGIAVSLGWLPTWDWSLVGGADRCDAFLALFVEPSGWCVKGRSVQAWCSVGYAAGYWLTVSQWQRVKAATKTNKPLFVDKLVIHQTDTEKKKMGIECIGGFLGRTREMLVLWEETYFSRLWCIFELAVFFELMNMSKNKRFTLLPISVTATELIASFVDCCAFVVSFGALTAVGGFGSFIQFFVELIQSAGVSRAASQYLTLGGTIAMVFALPCACTVWFMRKTHRARNRIVQQVQDFTVSGASCFDENDRVFVSRLVRQVYGSHSRFEDIARENIYREIGRQGGGAFRYPYGLAARALTPAAVYFGLDVPLMLGNPFFSWQLLSKLVGAAMVGWLHLPVVWYIIERASEVRLRTKGKFEEFFVNMALGHALAAPIGLYYCTIPSLLSDRWLPKMLGLFVGVASLAACFPQVRYALCGCCAAPLFGAAGGKQHDDTVGAEEAMPSETRQAVSVDQGAAAESGDGEPSERGNHSITSVWI